MDMVSNIGQMELIMKGNGATIKQRDRERFGMLKAMSIEENSKTIWQMAMVNTHTSMVLSIKVNFGMMSKKAMEKKNGSMEPNT